MVIKSYSYIKLYERREDRMAKDGLLKLKGVRIEK